MESEVISLLPRAEVEHKVFELLCCVAGKSFDNQYLQLKFGRVLFHPEWQGTVLLQCRLVHVGISGDVYVVADEIQRLLGVEIQHVRTEYLSYLVTKKLSHYGLHFSQLVKWQEHRSCPVLVSTYFYFNNQMVELLFDVQSLTIDDGFLMHVRNKLSGDLRLTSMMSPFYTELDSSEVRELDVDDVVLVYPN